MADHSQMRLGKQPPRHDPRTLQLANYLLTTELKPAPPTADWGQNIHDDAWGMMRNDTVGDCTCAAAGHMIQDWSSNVGRTITLGDDEIIAAYAAVSGYDPSSGANDNGAVEIDVLNYWRQTGIAGHTIDAYVALEPGNIEHVKDAINIFGGCYIGLGLPVSAQHQDTWTVPPGGPVGQGAPRSWGGHAVVLVAYNPRRVTCITWGQTKQMTWTFLRAYCEEAYALVSKDWLTRSGTAPNGVDLETLMADLEKIRTPQVVAAPAR